MHIHQSIVERHWGVRSLRSEQSEPTFQFSALYGGLQACLAITLLMAAAYQRLPALLPFTFACPTNLCLVPRQSASVGLAHSASGR